MSSLSSRSCPARTSSLAHLADKKRLLRPAYHSLHKLSLDLWHGGAYRPRMALLRASRCARLDEWIPALQERCRTGRKREQTLRCGWSVMIRLISACVPIGVQVRSLPVHGIHDRLERRGPLGQNRLHDGESLYGSACNQSLISRPHHKHTFDNVQDDNTWHLVAL